MASAPEPIIHIHTANTVGIVMIVIFIILIAFTIIYGVISYNNLKSCESHEKPICPTYYCNNTKAVCANGASGTPGTGGAAWRTDSSGNTQCQIYTVVPSVTNSTPAQRLSWPQQSN